MCLCYMFVLFDDKRIAERIAYQKGRNRAQKRILYRRKPTRAANDEVGRDYVEHFFFERLAYTPCLDEDFYLANVRVLLKLIESG